jgi:hypothetical protein
MQIFKDRTFVTGIYYPNRESIYIPDDCEEADKIRDKEEIDIDWENKKIGNQVDTPPEVMNDFFQISPLEDLKQRLMRLENKLVELEGKTTRNQEDILFLDEKIQKEEVKE